MKSTMYRIFLIMAAIMINCCTLVQGQIGSPSIAISYDASGNRTLRKVIIIYYKTYEHDTIDNDNTDSTVNRTNTDDKKTTVYDDNLGGYQIKVYPNPTNGWLNVQISNFIAGLTADITVYDPQNKLMLKNQCTSKFTKIDMSPFPKGAYLMDIRIDGKVSGWKIIKQ
jgi:hypothetical protein